MRIPGSEDPLGASGNFAAIFGADAATFSADSAAANPTQDWQPLLSMLLLLSYEKSKPT